MIADFTSHMSPSSVDLVEDFLRKPFIRSYQVSSAAVVWVCTCNPGAELSPKLIPLFDLLTSLPIVSFALASSEYELLSGILLFWVRN